MRFRAALAGSAAVAALATAPLPAPFGATSAWAQVESREGIFLQNQILGLRQELEILRRGGAVPTQPQYVPPPPGRNPVGPGYEVIAGLVARVQALEEEIARQRGAAQQAEFESRRLREQIEKLQGDVEYRFNQLEGRGGAPAPGGRPGPAAPTAAGPLTPPSAGGPPAAAPGPAAAPAGPPPPRTPERALQDAQAALIRRDYAAAEAAAREVLAVRGSPRAQDAGILLGDALAGKRDFQQAALAYDEAYHRAPSSGRAPDAQIGLANAFIGFGARREACETLDGLRSNNPRLSAALTDRANAARQRAGCR